MRFRLRALAVPVLTGAVLLSLFGLIGAAGTATAAPPRSTTAGPGPVVLLGTGGLRWSDLDGATRPTLSAFLADGSSGWLADRSVRPVTCPVDGWLAVSAGSRAADTATGSNEPSCREPQVELSTAGGQGTVPRWQAYLNQAAHDQFEAKLGLLGGTLARIGDRGAAVGPGAAIALADPHGQVPHAWPGRVDDAAGTADPQLLVTDVRAALATNPNVLAVDLGAVVDPAQQPNGRPALTGAYARPRPVQVQSLVTRLGLVLDALPANATVVLASLADSGTPSRLQLVAGRGPAPLGGSFSSSLLGSRSTRQNGLVQGTDLLSTLLAARSLSTPDGAVGSSLEPVSSGGSPSSRLRKLTDLDQASHGITPIVPWFFEGLVTAQLVLYGVVTLGLRRRSALDPEAARIGRRRTLRRLRQGAVVFASVPISTFLANLLPWWRSGTPGLAITGAVIVFVIPIAAVALLGPWRNYLLGPMGAVGAITGLVLGTDVLTGSHLEVSSLMGLQPVVAGRFYGFGNPAFALFSTGWLLFAIAVSNWLIDRGRRTGAGVAVILVGCLATVIDGTPGLGSDFGGPPAIIPAFAVLALFAFGVRVTWRRVLIIAAITISVIILLSVIDWLRPSADRTHLGRFVQTVLDGKAWPVIRRKGQANLRILFTSYLSALLPFAVAFVVLVLARPVAWGVRPLQLAYDRSPMLRSGLIAFGVLMFIGVALNDSGTATPADAATVAIPLLIAASVRALELQDGEPVPVQTPVAAGP